MKIGRDDAQALTLFAITIAFMLVMSRVGPGFGSASQIEAILVLASFVMVVAFGQHFVVLIGGLDLAVGSVMTLGGILAFAWIGDSATALWWGVPAIVAITGLVGAISGIGVAFARIPPFVMTLAMGTIAASAFLGITQGVPRGSASPFISSLFTGSWIGLPPVVVLTIALTALGSIVQRMTALGRRVYAIGINPNAAFLAGLPVRRVTILCYAVSGATAGLAGILMMGYSSGATLTMGQSYLLPSIAAVVVGGTSIAGGRGSLAGVAAGALLLTTFTTLVTGLAVGEGWRIVAYGSVILIALLLLRSDVSRWFKPPSGIQTSTARLDAGA
ncbi:MAG TPA: ABC transporter permease [Candidatus Elarobacter sp.]|nr:ABC transporter permease [Candidatus Elarobacter sp.]